MAPESQPLFNKDELMTAALHTKVQAFKRPFGMPLPFALTSGLGPYSFRTSPVSIQDLHLKVKRLSDFTVFVVEVEKMAKVALIQVIGAKAMVGCPVARVGKES